MLPTPSPSAYTSMVSLHSIPFAARAGLSPDSTRHTACWLCWWEHLERPFRGGLHLPISAPLLLVKGHFLRPLGTISQRCFSLMSTRSSERKLAERHQIRLNNQLRPQTTIFACRMVPQRCLCISGGYFMLVYGAPVNTPGLNYLQSKPYTAGDFTYSFIYLLPGSGPAVNKFRTQMSPI